MSEADWWLCGRCQSLNNLSARKCYSCHQRKPKNAQRASEYLGYVPIVSHDGKVSLQAIQPPAEAKLRAAPTKPPPLREPILRDTLAVAPRPPEGASITYLSRLEPPSLPGHPAGPLGATMARPPMPPGSLPALSSPAGAQGPPWGAGRPSVPLGPGPLQPPSGPPVEMTAIPILGQTQAWPHWQELLDGPTPEGMRLRATHRSADGGPAGDDPPSRTDNDHALSRAIRQAEEGAPSASRHFIPWPVADRPASEPQVDPDEAGHDPIWPPASQGLTER